MGPHTSELDTVLVGVPIVQTGELDLVFVGVTIVLCPHNGELGTATVLEGVSIVLWVHTPANWIRFL